jgi:predicted 3-demethylubiquinone-9 3-methyltransferase (glyoxalase superfamily)
MSEARKISTCLWFDRDGEHAANFYVSLFANSRVTKVSRYGEGAPLPAGTAMMTTFELGGVPYMALNGGPMFALSEAVSIVAQCDDQAEIDRLWSALTADGGRESRCGWLKDRFGLSWQIVPRRLGELMAGGDRAASGRVFAAMMKMAKFDIATLDAAAAG